jgi:hypothetical protein
MLSSNRKFGVEIEFITPAERNLRSIARQLRVEHDGSLRPHRYAGEYISPVLRGEEGESELHNACSILKRNYADSSDIQTSVHIHLDAQGKPDITITDEPTKDTLFAVSNKVWTKIGRETILRDFLIGNKSLVRDGRLKSKRFNGMEYISYAELSNKPTSNFVFVNQSNGLFNFVRNAFYFYTMFSETLEQLVSHSRRDGNMYCIPLHKSYDLEQIEACGSLNDIRQVWYKTTGEGGRYNDSRYHSMNLHSLFHGPGTIEIRSHGGTIDSYKILLWVKLHQCILDKLENMTLDEVKGLRSDDMLEALLAFVDDAILQDYIKRLYGYYSNY